MGPLYGLPLLLSPSPHSGHVPLSGLLTHCWCSIFCHRVLGRLTGLPIAAGPGP
ncbi:unnamed protein product [Staurois parvus]|uniref:Uncharacterized protein n=1 Tax=Staurois parvus TaxID=386267 RepID=A0ABN9CB88_9NEOB|nr:unnamed protein product [Staurois parvus]